MENSEYGKMEYFEKFYWWHRGKLFMINSLLEKYLLDRKGKLKIMEIGCGTGETLNVLKDWGEIYGLDVSEEAVTFSRKKGFENVELADINSIDIQKYMDKFDVVVAFDVLEHIQDDVETLKRINLMVKKEGYVFMNVPAHKFLWSSHDEALHHKRRYHSVELTQKLKDTGFVVIKKTHFVFFVFFPIALYKLLSNFIRRAPYPKASYIVLPDRINNFLTALLYLEAKLIKNVNLPIGTTLSVVAKK